MKPRFPVPVSWQALEPKVTVEDFRADTTVLHLTQNLPEAFRIFPVEDRRHTTPKLYRIEVLNPWSERWHTWMDVRPCCLGILPVGSLCLIEVPIRGFHHAIWTDRKGSHVTWGDLYHHRALLCREPFSGDFGTPATYGEVTCRECLKVKTAWLPVRVEPYEHPRLTEKHRRKAQNITRIRAKFPTVFDRLGGDFLDED